MPLSRFLSLLVLVALTGCAPAPPSEDAASPHPSTTVPTSTAAAGLPAVADHGMVVSAHLLASQVGDSILRQGGNAVDAAVATGFALAVVYPRAGNIGGGGFTVLRFPDGRATTVDYRETAPLAAHPRMWLDEDGEYDRVRHHRSHVAVGVPGTVAGFAYLHEEYGSLPWSELVDPAVRLAADGFAMTPRVAESLRSFLPTAERYPATLDAYFDDGVPYQPGEIFRQRDLARTLARIRDRGPADFYTGETARLLVAEMERGGGIMTLEDLARYEPVERAPVTGSYRGYGVIGMPPPASGGTALIQMLNILEGYDLRAMGHNSADYLHHLAEAMRLAYRDRARYIADPDFVDVPVQRLTSDAYAAQLRATIQSDTVSPSSVHDTATAGVGGRETTHFSVVDASGMAASTTYTLEYSYGSGITVPGAGFLLNNEMGDFNPAPGLTTEGGLIGTAPNLARPGKRMLSSMTPTILTTTEGELLALVGSPGGRRIINIVLQATLNLLEFDMDLVAAIEASRVHHQWLPDRIQLETADWPDDVLSSLRQRGHTLDIGGTFGHVHAIRVGPGGSLVGVADARDADGGAVGH